VDLGSVRRGVAERPEEALDEIHEALCSLRSVSVCRVRTAVQLK
jgi:hypothetical protein